MNNKEFLEDLKNIGVEQTVEKHLCFGTPHIFKNTESLYYELKSEIAKEFNIDQSHIYMAGSAKLGFSLSPLQLWKPFDEESDIDMVIISTELFDVLWKELFNFDINTMARTEREDQKYIEFLQYFFKGWLRPDKFPTKFVKKFTWFDFLQIYLTVNMEITK